MLRQALEEDEERTKLIHKNNPPVEEAPSYGTRSDEGQLSTYDEEESEDDDEDDDDVTLDDEDALPPTCFQKFCKTINDTFVVIANVENLWDTDSNVDPSNRRRNHLIVLFWFVVLAASYAGERTTFKLLSDQSGPFRIFSVEVVTATHAIMLGVFMILGRVLGYGSKLSLGISLVDVALMAILDTANLLLVFLSAYHVPPTLTVILVQFTLPLTAFFTQFVHPRGRYACWRRRENNNNNNSSEISGAKQTMDDSPIIQDMQDPHEYHGCGGLAKEHTWGSLLLAMAVLLALLPALYSIINPEFWLYADPIPLRTAANSLMYVSACIPAAASQLYKGMPQQRIDLVRTG